MDVEATVCAVRREYKEYLTVKHPEWAENTLKSHVSDAFYIWSHTLLPSFWGTMVNSQTMETGRQAIFHYLKNDLLTDAAEERTQSYFSDLSMLKQYVDATFGGIEKCIGDEIYCEKTIYNLAKAVYVGQTSEEQAVQILAQKVPYFHMDAHKRMIQLFAALMDGQPYTWCTTPGGTLFLISQIGADYGKKHLTNALTATRKTVQDIYERTGNPSGSICRGCRKIAAEYGLETLFDKSVLEGIVPKQSCPEETSTVPDQERYWIYSPRHFWQQFRSEGIMTIGHDYLGDPLLYGTKKSMQCAMSDCGTEKNTTTYKNAVLELWQFLHEMKPGDIIIAKQGLKTVLGRGVVTSEWIYDETKPTDLKYYRRVHWTHQGEWRHPGRAITKTLTDITPYHGYVAELKSLFTPMGMFHRRHARFRFRFPEKGASAPFPTAVQMPKTVCDAYTEADFLRDVYMSEERYHTLKRLLFTKKNIILQGAPGVGKTFLSKRLAYAVMGEKDDSRVKIVQFHQSYCYEDFVMGFRPTQTGFELKTGVFYEFCKKAACDDRPYFLLIDELNRGNLSKIFGELFMLIENDKRGETVQLLYSDQPFSVPDNLYIIGTMNTADRSLAMLDYALRRRFAFFEIPPALDSGGFTAYLRKQNHPKLDQLIELVRQLNREIAQDESLGEGFCIGHSFFCTNDPITEESLKSVVEFELIPLLKEYWFDEPAKVKDWACTFRELIK